MHIFLHLPGPINSLFYSLNYQTETLEYFPVNFVKIYVSAYVCVLYKQYDV